MSSAINFLELINYKDEDIKKIVADKTTLEIVLLIYRYEMNKINIKSADKFLEENQITASRSKKIAVIQKLVQNKILNREVNKDDKRSKMIYLNKSIKDKLDKILK